MSRITDLHGKDNSIFEVLGLDNFMDWANQHQVFEKSTKLELEIWNGSNSLQITDLKNAMKTGLECVSYKVYNNSHDRNFCIINFLCYFGYNLQSVFNFCESQVFSKNKWDYLDEITVSLGNQDYKIIKSFTKSIRVFSPFSISELKPLQEIPKKWTMTHIYKVLANGQYTDLKCTGHYTDDYAFDASCDFGKGKVNNGLGLLEDIMQSPSGWWVYSSDGEVRFSCHHFLGYSFIPVIVKREESRKLNDIANSGNSIAIRKNEEKNGIEVIFREKPEQSIIDSLKSHGFRWSRFGGLWYNHYNDSNWEFANTLI